MDTLNITLVGIAVPRDRHRMLRPDNVDAIAESMKAQGSCSPSSCASARGAATG